MTVWEGLYSLAEQQKARDQKIIHLDKNGKNVIVLMLDRAVGYF